MIHPHEQLPFYAAGQLSDRQRAEIESHLATCDECRAELDEWLTLASTVRRNASARVNGHGLPPLKLTPHFPKGQPMTTYVSTRSNLRPSIWMTFAATLIIALVGVMLSLRGTSPILPGSYNQFTGLNPITTENAAELTQLTTFGRGIVRDMALSPDGQTLAVAAETGIYLHADESSQLLGTPGTYSRVIFAGDKLAVSTPDRVIALWDAQTGEVLKTLDLTAELLQINADATRALVMICDQPFFWACETVQYAVYNLETDEVTVVTRTMYHPWSAYTATMNEDGTVVAISRTADSVVSFEVRESSDFGADEPTKILPGSGISSGGSMRIEGRTLVAAGVMQPVLINVWDIDSGERDIYRATGTDPQILDITADGFLYFAQSNSGSPDMLTFQPFGDFGTQEIRRISDPDGFTMPQTAYAAGRFAVQVGGADIQIWDETPATITGYLPSVDNLNFTTTDEVAFVSYGVPQVWNFETGEQTWREADSERVYFSGPLAVIGDTFYYPEDLGASTALRMWNRGASEPAETRFEEWENGQVVTMRQAGDELVIVIFIDHSNSFVVTRGTGDTFTHFEFPGVGDVLNEEVGTMSGWLSSDGSQFYVMRCFAQSIMSCSGNWGLQIYDTTTGEMLYSNDSGLFQEWYYQVTPRPGSNQFAAMECTDRIERRFDYEVGYAMVSICTDRTFTLNTLENGELSPLWTVTNESETADLSTASAAFTPDGTLVAYVTGKTLYMLDAVTGEELASYPVPEYARVAFNQDGTMLAVASNGTVSLWGIAD